MTILASTTINTKFGHFRVAVHQNKTYQCVSFSRGDLSRGTPVVRIHSSCLFGEAFHSLHCDCGHQITGTMKAIKKKGAGVIVYSYQEGRGLGLVGKIKGMEIQRKQKCDTIEAYAKMGFGPDSRDYRAEIRALKDLKLCRNITTFSGNPKKIKALEKAGYQIKGLLKLDREMLSEIAREEVVTKIKKMGYHY